MTLDQVRLQGCWSEGEVEGFLQEAIIPMRIGVLDSLGAPWVHSLWFLYENGALWCATNSSAKLVSYLQAHPQCGFEITADTPPYRGIRGKEQASLDAERGGAILMRLLDRYGIARQSGLAKSLLAKVDQELAIRIAPSRISSWDFTSRMAGALSDR